MDVDDHERGLAERSLDELVDHLEHRARGVEEQRAEHVDDGEPSAVLDRHDGHSAPGAQRGGVCGADDALGRLEIGPDLHSPEGVVAECDDIRPGCEHPVGKTWRDADPVREVLTVQDAGVRSELGAETAKTRLDRPPPGGSDDVGDEEDPQGSGPEGLGDVVEGRRGKDLDRHVVAAIGCVGRECLLLDRGNVHDGAQL